MYGKKQKALLREYGFLAEPHIVMTESAALALTAAEGVPSFEWLVNAARAKSALPDEAWAPAERAAERHAKRERRSFGRSKRRFAVLALLLAAALLVAVIPPARSYAYNAVVRLWSALVHWDADYLRMDYSGSYEDHPPYSSPTSGGEPVDMEMEEVVISSLDELRAFMDGRVLFPYEMEGVEFKNGTGSVAEGTGSIEDEDYGVLTALYTVNGVKVNCHCIVKNDMAADIEEGYASFGTIFNDNYDEVYEKNVEGVDCIFGEGEGKSVCSFVCENGSYVLSVDSGAELTEAIVRSMLSGAFDEE